MKEMGLIQREKMKELQLRREMVVHNRFPTNRIAVVKLSIKILYYLQKYLYI